MKAFSYNSTERVDSDVLDQYIKIIANSDKDALGKLYNSTSGSVYGFALSILKNMQDAEDVLHDTYLRIYSSASGYKSKGKALAWILTITKNLCLMKLRERKKTADIPEESWDLVLERLPEMTPEDRLVLTACMNKLSDEESRIVMLYAVSGFKHREIADLLSLPLSTVLSKYRRALKKLRKFLTEEN
ncbi:MAG: RNA polymerase sigma factor [Clostridiales bacterium]|nr:RNA polymerase sigma factor [Clostridiales bacterium]